MTKDQKIKDLEMALQQEKENSCFYKQCLERSEKRLKALKHGITSISAHDLGFMMNFETNDKDLLDVYNELIYSFGRPFSDGRVYTRMSCPRN